MNIEKYKQFKDIVQTTNQLNSSKKAVTFLILKNNELYIKRSLSLYDLNNVKYIIAIGTCPWNNGPYHNESATILGMFNEEFSLIEEIPLSNGYSISEIKFTVYTGSYYNEFKPTFIIRNGDSTQQVVLEKEEENGWDSDFHTLFKKVKDIIQR